QDRDPDRGTAAGAGRPGRRRAGRRPAPPPRRPVCGRHNSDEGQAVSYSILIRTPESTYPVEIGGGILDRIGEYAPRLGLGRAVAVATDTTVAPLHGGRVQAALRAAGFAPFLVPMPAGEAHKGWPALDGYIRG